MRPRELVVEGVMSLRERTTVDFADADLFALFGPTGAGKSSVLDAISLALYGRVPRLGERDLAPLLSSGAPLARVALRFDVGTDSYRAVREIHPTATGVSTREAVLDRVDAASGDTVVRIAEDAAGVTERVARLIGLDFARFTKVVMLPQGRFADLLSTTGRARRELLVGLLGLEVYGEVGTRARARARDAEQRATWCGEQLERYADVTQAAVEEADAAVRRLDGLLERVTDLVAERDRREQGARAAAEEVTRAQQARAALDAVVTCPPEVRALSATIAAADRALADAQAALDDAASAGDERRVAVEALAGDRAAAQAALAAHEQAARLLDAATQAREEAHRADADATAQADRAAAARASADAARAAAAAGERVAAAATAAAGVSAGDPCPVCARPLDAPPHVDVPADVQTRIQAATEAERAALRLTTRAEQSAEQAAALARRADAADAHAAEAAAAAEQRMALEAARELQAAAAVADAQLEAAREAWRQASTATDRRRTQRQALDAQATQARTRLDGIRTALGDPTAPVIGPDVAASWDALHAWAGGLVAVREAAVVAARAAATEADRRVAEQTQAIAAALHDAGLHPPAGTAAREAAAEARATARARLAHLRQRLDEAADLRARHEEATRTARVEREVGRLCASDRIQQWVLTEALDRLVDLANAELATLSGGRYELDHDRSEFRVVDLHDGGAVRTYRTLSGGETFLVSLALALALADEVAATATAAVRAEALFIDEGFGTLDPSRLDLAADVLEQLGARERMVGIVTHVAELAGRLPVRYEVTPGPPSGSARVRRIDA